MTEKVRCGSLQTLFAKNIILTAHAHGNSSATFFASHGICRLVENQLKSGRMGLERQDESHYATPERH